MAESADFDLAFNIALVGDVGVEKSVNFLIDNYHLRDLIFNALVLYTDMYCTCLYVICLKYSCCLNVAVHIYFEFFTRAYWILR